MKSSAADMAPCENQLVIRAALLLAVVACAAVAQNPATDDGFVSLFNGHDLGAWVGNQQQWTVQDGILRGVSDGKAESALVLSGRDYGDFELRFDLRVIRGAGWVQMRGYGRGPVGVELEVDSSTDSPMVRWLVNGSRSLAVAYFKPREWNAYRIICRERSFIAFQNQVQSPLTLIVGHIDLIGKIALVMPEGIPSEIEMRNIRLKE